MTGPCLHSEFYANANVIRLTDHPENPADRFALDLRVHCTECGTPFRFIGLPGGSNFEGATVSADGYEARLSIRPGAIGARASGGSQ